MDWVATPLSVWDGCPAASDEGSCPGAAADSAAAESDEVFSAGDGEDPEDAEELDEDPAAGCSDAAGSLAGASASDFAASPEELFSAATG